MKLISNNNLTIPISIIFLIVIIFVLPIYIDYKTPRVNSYFAVDISLSDQRYKEQIEDVCRTFISRQIENDQLTIVQFDHTSRVIMNTPFREKNKMSIENQRCSTLTERDNKEPLIRGTDIIEAWDDVITESIKNSTQHHLRKSIIIIMINATEQVQGKKPPDWDNFHQQAKEFVNNGNILILLISDMELHKKLSRQMSSTKDIWVRTYDDGKDLINTTYNKLRSFNLFSF